MSNMFDNYEVVTSVPNNLNKSCSVKSCNKPYEEYDAEGKLVGYYWYYGTAINLQFNITGEVSIDSDSIIYTASGETPTSSTIGNINQKAYNVTDFISWTCSAVLKHGKDYEFIWQRDDEFTYPFNGNKSLYISADQYLKDKTAKIELFNFRHELIHEEVVEASSIINFNIDLELSKKLRKGVYYGCISILSESSIIYLNHLNDDAIVFNVK